MIDGNGLVNKAWSIWFRDLYKRTSYKGGNAIDSIQDQVNALIIAVDELAKQVAENVIAIAKNASDIAANAVAIKANLDAINFLRFDVIDAGAPFTTTKNQIVIANGNDITLNATPEDEEQAHVKVDKRMISITAGGNRKMDGVSKIKTTRPYMSLHFAYSRASDEWRII